MELLSVAAPADVQAASPTEPSGLGVAETVDKFGVAFPLLRLGRHGGEQCEQLDRARERWGASEQDSPCGGLKHR